MASQVSVPEFLLAALADLATHHGYDRRAVTSAVRHAAACDRSGCFGEAAGRDVAGWASPAGSSDEDPGDHTRRSGRTTGQRSADAQ